MKGFDNDVRSMAHRILSNRQQTITETTQNTVKDNMENKKQTIAVNGNMIQFNIPRWGITEMNGYVPRTTFWEDFIIAEHFGEEAVRDTYRKSRAIAGDDAELRAELSLVLNHRIWALYEKNEALARVYDALWREYDQWAYETLSDEGRQTYHRITD